MYISTTAYNVDVYNPCSHIRIQIKISLSHTTISKEIFGWNIGGIPIKVTFRIKLNHNETVIKSDSVLRERSIIEILSYHRLFKSFLLS